MKHIRKKTGLLLLILLLAVLPDNWSLTVFAQEAADSTLPELQEAPTGGINLWKTDTMDNPLASASFCIARLATQEEYNDRNIIKEALKVGNSEQIVIFVDFYPTASMTGEKTYEVSTDEEGKASLYGLPYGTYFLVENRAPAGYNLPTQPLIVAVSETSHLTQADGCEDAQRHLIDNTIHIVNTKLVLPDTGGMGTKLFTILGITILASAGLLLLTNYKKRV